MKRFVQLRNYENSTFCINTMFWIFVLRTFTKNLRKK